MELRQLRYFMAVADELHFGRAAQQLHMSQPPLSVQIGRLEEEIGVALFERSTRHVALTSAGRHLQAKVRQVLEDIESVRLEMRDYAVGAAGELNVGFVSSASYTVIPGVVQLFRARRAGVALSLVPLTSGEQVEQLCDGRLDVGIVRDGLPGDVTATESLQSEVVFEERLVACLPSGHALSQADVVSADALSDVPMISYPQTLMPGYVERIEEVFAASGRRANVVQEVVHQETALGFVAAGLGMTVLPESVRDLVPPSISVVPLAGGPVSRLIAVRRTRPRHALICDAFVDCVREVASSTSAESSGATRVQTSAGSALSPACRRWQCGQAGQECRSGRSCSVRPFTVGATQG